MKSIGPSVLALGRTVLTWFVREMALAVFVMAPPPLDHGRSSGSHPVEIQLVTGVPQL